MDQPINATEALQITATIRDEVSKVVIGQQLLLDKLLPAVLADGHVCWKGLQA